MRDILTERGVSEGSMRLEDQAASTVENFQNTIQIISPDEPVVLISSNYHMDRAVKTARNAGFTKNPASAGAVITDPVRRQCDVGSGSGTE